MLQISQMVAQGAVARCSFSVIRPWILTHVRCRSLRCPEYDIYPLPRWWWMSLRAAHHGKLCRRVGRNIGQFSHQSHATSRWLKTSSVLGLVDGIEGAGCGRPEEMMCARIEGQNLASLHLGCAKKCQTRHAIGISLRLLKDAI